MVELQGRQGDVIVLSFRELVVKRSGNFCLSISNLDIHSGETLAIIGPNGAGKTTFLLTISRLIRPVSGEMYYRGTNLNSLDDLNYRRKIALVLQDPLLFNTNVYNNVAAGLRFRKIPSVEIENKASEWLSRLEIDHLRKRHTSTLSGGQAQRVSLARALVLEPDILLLDEPFGALDSPTRKSLMEDLRKLLYETGTTTILITHDQDEALYFGDRLAVFIDGNLRQVGSAQTIFSNPEDVDVAEFVGVENVFPGTVSSRMGSRVNIDIHGLQFEAVGDFLPGQSVLFCLRPEDITLWSVNGPSKSSARNRISGSVKSSNYHGPLVRVIIDCGIPIIAVITRASASDLEIKEGSQIMISFKASAVHLIQK